MRLFGRDLDDDIAIIAEIGVNHEGDVDVAAALVHAAAGAGADAVKFQSYTPERFVSPTDAERFARVTRFALDESAHRRLAAEAARAGISFFSAAITEDWVPLISELSPAVKIASGDLTFEPVIRAAARSGRAVILSTGCGTIDEVDRAVDWVRAEIGAEALPERLALLHCVSAYPTPIEETNLRSIPFMASRYGITVGWSNHVIGPEACIAATALGAGVIEVHVTDRRTGRTFRDHEMSFEPAELAELIDTLRRVRRSLGILTKAPAPSELPNRDAIRKGIIAARELPAGTVIAEADVMFSRPATDLPAVDLGFVVGRRTTRRFARLERLRRDGIEG